MNEKINSETSNYLISMIKIIKILNSVTYISSPIVFHDLLMDISYRNNTIFKQTICMVYIEQKISNKL